MQMCRSLAHSLTHSACILGVIAIEFLSLTSSKEFSTKVGLFSNRSLMTSKCGKNKKLAHEAIAECVTDVLTTF